MKKTLTALAFLTAAAVPSLSNAQCGPCGPVCPAPRPVCCAPTCTTVCTQPVCYQRVCCPEIRGFLNGGNAFPGGWGRIGCNPCCY